MKYFNFIAALLLILLYSLGSIPPHERFNLWLVNFIIPFALILNIILLVTGILLRKKSSVFFLLALVFGGGYLFSTIGIKSIFKGSHLREVRDFTVLNYNLGSFNTRLGSYDTGDAKGIENQMNKRSDSLRLSMMNWVLNSDGDIKCFQEFAFPPSPGDIDLLEAFHARGYDHYFSAAENRRERSHFGILIVSRFPIVAHGDVMASKNGYNRIAFVDVRFRGDTVRVVNVHLQSMQMKNLHPGLSGNLEDQTRNARVVLRKLKSGVFERSRQIRELAVFIKTSRYPVVCAGDFNELPYSYSYQMLKKRLYNTFEESGKGFGFTYNGNTLSMLRIDNQFYSSALKSVAFQTLDSVRYTDHFLVIGTYQIRESRQGPDF